MVHGQPHRRLQGLLCQRVLLLYLVEFKVVEIAPAGSALAQLRQRRYADKYRATGAPIHLIGVEFSRDTRNITAFETADA